MPCWRRPPLNRAMLPLILLAYRWSSPSVRVADVRRSASRSRHRSSVQRSHARYMLIKYVITDCAAAENADVRKASLNHHLVLACALLVTMGVHCTPRAAETAATAVPHRSRSEASLLDADARRFQAMVDRDIPALNRALADELVYVHSSSTRQNKSEHDSRYRGG